jgi:hypothetical protein
MAAKVSVFVPVIPIAMSGWSIKSAPIDGLVVAWIAMLLGLIALAERPVLRCDECAHTTSAS